MKPATEQVSLSQAAEYLLEECRMVLPGIQALFGFQLIAVFNAGFHERLSQGLQRLHLLAIALVALFGGFGTWRVLSAPPVPYLRSE